MEDVQTKQSLSDAEATVSNKNTDNNKSRKRKRPFDDALTTAYSSVSFAPRKLTGECPPDSPHFFFSSSYTVIPSDVESESKEETVAHSNDDTGIQIQQVVHQHVNGLCMVTAGELSIPESMILKSIRFLAKEAPSCSNAAKRKRQAKMLRGKGKVDHVVTPSTVIAELVLEERSDGEEGKEDSENPKTTIIPLYACVWGTILEVNSTALTPDVLLSDPLLDGFIAIILPTGKFPPTQSISEAIDSNPPVDPDRKDS